MKEYKNNKFFFFLKLFVNLFFIFFIFYKKKFLIQNKKKKNINNKIKNNKKNIYEIISRLKNDSPKRLSKYILLFDFYKNPYCNDYNAYYIFKYYLKNKNYDAFYIINYQSDLYNALLKENNTQNLIPVHSNDNIFNLLYNYILNSKIIINSYIFIEFQLIINEVDFLKYLYLTHAVGYFKKLGIKYEFKYLKKNKRNIIATSPKEYEIYKYNLNYSESYIHKAGLPRYDRFQYFKKNISEKDCILISFTYRSYNNKIYEQSLLKINLEKLLNDTSLMKILNKNNIDLIYIPHHFDVLRKRIINIEKFPFIKYKKQNFLSHYIEQCSLLITDFSTISFDFMFLNKPVLYYLIDLKDKIKFREREYMYFDPKNNIYYGNAFYNQQSLIEKINYYIKRNFTIEDNIKKEYNSLFFYKKNITGRIVEIINEIIHK